MPAASATAFFYRGQDWTGVDSAGDGLQDWWKFFWFNSLAESATNLDSQGNTLLYDNQNNINPDLVNFTVRLGNQHFNTTNATGTFLTLGKVPGYMKPWWSTAPIFPPPNGCPMTARST